MELKNELFIITAGTINITGSKYDIRSWLKNIVTINSSDLVQSYVIFCLDSMC